MRPTLSVVMPLFNAEGHLPRVLPPLLDALSRGELLEIIVADDASTDGGPEICRRHGLTVLPGKTQLGPGARRNLGVQSARGDVVLFVDSDVIVRPEVPAQVAQVFADNPDCVALFGSYDDSPQAPGIVSRYRNLLHHHVHQQGSREATTFWAGCGAVRRDAFLAVGGFDVARYPNSSIEDIELGHRLRQRGRILLCKEIQSTHLKRWTFWNMLYTDIYRRAIPWTRLTLQPGYTVNDLNLSPAEKGRAALAGLFWLSLLLSPALPWALLAAGAALGVAWLANRPFFSLVRRRCGWGAMLVSVLLQQFHYLYGVAAFLLCWLDGTSRLSGSLARFNALSLGTIVGLVLGGGLWLATVILLLEAGPETGRTLKLLGQYFLFYDVTPAGAFIGLAWGFVTGFVLTTPPAWLYYRSAAREAERLVLRPARRVGLIRAPAFSVACGLLAGNALLLATWWLLLKHRPGEPLGAHLGRLSQYLPAYSVSLVGGLIGFAWMFTITATSAACVAWIYNRMARPGINREG